MIDNFKPQSIIKEEEEEEEPENEEKKLNEDGSEDQKIKVSPSKKHFLRNSKSYVALRENYIGIQNRIVELAQRDQDRRLNENTENTEQKSEPIVCLEKTIEDQNKTKMLFENEDNIQDTPLNGSISVKDYKQYHEAVSTPLNAINETNDKYHQLEKNINNAKEKLDQLIDAEENILKNNQNSVIDDQKNSMKSDLFSQSSSSYKHHSNSRISINTSKSNISSNRKKGKSIIISDEKLTQVGKQI